MTKKKVTPLTTIRFKAYEIIERAVNDGIEWGWSRAHKHTDDPSAGTIQDEILQNVMTALSDVIDFGDGEIDE